MTGPDLEFRLLGPLEVVLGHEVLALGRGRDRSVLALLLLHANQVVPADRFVDALWGRRPPPSAPHALQVHVSNLRKRLEPGRIKGSDASSIRTQPPGYLIQVRPDQLDVTRFEHLARAGREALRDGDPGTARSNFHRALALWRGPALADLTYEPWAEHEAARLEALKLTVMEDGFEAELAAACHIEALGALEVFARQNPLRERAWGLLLLALYRSGRQADALRAADTLRATLRDELGLDPSSDIRALEQAMLAQDPRLDLPGPASAATLAAVEDSQASATVPPSAYIPETEPPPVSSSRHDEQKMVTALFADLSGSTALGEVLDPEEFKVVVDEAVSRMIAAVARYGGTVVNVAGDGILALFGAPQAHEDDAERAVRAGLEIVSDVGTYGSEVTDAWDVAAPAAHVGIHTGPVVIGPMGGGEVELTAMGDTINTASRLEGAAPPGTVVVGPSTRHQLEALFEFAEGRELRLKGKSDRVLVSEVTGVQVAQAKVRGLAGIDVELIGRQREFDTGRTAVDAVLTGTGGVLLITGEAGMGKSRLLHELAGYFDHVGSEERPKLWLAGRSLSYGEQLPYGPWREMLRIWLGVAAADPDLRVKVRLQGRLGSLFGAAGRDLQPFLGNLLGLRLDPDAAEQVRTLSPEALHDETLRAIVTLLGRLATDGPVVVALDDMHWADGDSIRVVEQLLEVTELAALLVITAQRLERAHPSWTIHDEALRRLPHRTSEIALGPLAGGGDAALLEALVGPTTLPPQLRVSLLDAAEGNPFFLEELIRSLLDVGALVRDGPEWRLGREVSLEVPETVEKVIQSRIDGLSTFGRDVLAAASVLGRQFEFDLLGAIVDEPRALDSSLRDLQRLDMVREAQRWPRQEFRFKHSLIQETAYRSLVSSRRRLLHGRAARVLEARTDEEAPPANSLLAHHFEQAGELAAALRFHRLAAGDARAIHAQRSAFAHYDAALRLVDSLPASDEVPTLALAELALGRGQLYRQVGQDDEAARDLHRALAEARAASSTRIELEVMSELGMIELQRGTQDDAFRRFEAGLSVAQAVGNDAAEASLLGRLAIESVRRLQFVDALDQGTRAVALARSTADESAIARALDGLKLVTLSLGDLQAFRPIITELEMLLRHQDDKLFLQHALAEHAVEAGAGGRWNEALSLFDEAVALNRATGNRADRPLLLSMRANVERAHGLYGAATRSTTEASALSQELTHRLWAPWASVTRSALHVDLADPAGALAALEPIQRIADREVADDQLLRGHAYAALAQAVLGHRDQATRALTAAEELRRRVVCPPGWIHLYGFDAEVAAARAYGLLGDSRRGLTLLDPVLVAAERAGWSEAIASAALALGELLALDQPDSALVHAERSLEVSRVTGLPGIEWRAHGLHAALLRRAGRPADASVSVARAAELVGELSRSLDDDRLARGFRQRAQRQLDRVIGQGPGTDPEGSAPEPPVRLEPRRRG